MKLFLFAIVSLFTLAIGVSFAYADTMTLKFDAENLNETNTGNQTTLYPNGNWEHKVWLEWIYRGDNSTEFNPRAVLGDPVGRFVDLMGSDLAGVFEPIVQPIQEIVAVVKTIIANVTEPVPVYTTDEQNLIDNVHKHCDKLKDRLEVIGRALDFEYESDEYYATHELQAKLASEDCRARLYLGDNILSSMYDELAREELLDADNFANLTSTDISSTGADDYSIEGDIWNERAREALADAKKLPGIGLAYDTQYKEINHTVSTINNSPSGEELDKREHQQMEVATNRAQMTACTNSWIEVGEGTVALTKWEDRLLDGECNGFIIDYVEDEKIFYVNVTQAKIDRAQFEIDEAERLQREMNERAEAQQAEHNQRAQDDFDARTAVNGTKSGN